MKPLYEKHVSPAGKVTYREYSPKCLPDMAIETEQITAIFSTLVLSMLISLSEQLQPHSKLGRETKLLEQAVARYGNLNSGKMDTKYVEVGVMAWNQATKAVQEGIMRLGDAL